MNVSAADIKAHLTTVARNIETGACLVRCVNPACSDWAPEVGTYAGAWDVAFEHREIMGQNEAMVDDMTTPAAPVADFGSDFDCCTAPVVIA